MTSALHLIAGLLLAGCISGGAPVSSGKAVKPAPIVGVDDPFEHEPANLPAEVQPDTAPDDGPEIADKDIPIPDDFETTANEDISDANLEAELKELEAAIGD